MSAEKRVEISELRHAADANDGEIVTGLDRFGRIVDQHWIDGMSTATDRFQYGYDENSNRLFRRNVVDATFSELYAYDDFNQLSDFARGTLSTTSDSIVGTPVRSQDWSPHPLGNAATISTSISGTPTPEGRLYNAQNQFTSVGGNSINYDANGNLITDQHGNIYKYDAWNRLVKVEDSSNDLLTVYSYNALNRRIIEDDGTTETHLFYSAGWQVLEEQVSGQTTTQYVWSPVYIDALILRDRDTDSNGSLDERLYVQQDANFNVTALVDALTGDVVQRFVQDPFGLVTDVLDDSWSPQGDVYDWKYLHQGLRLDMAVGMNLYDGRNRIYDPVLQRWIQVDPSGFSAGDSNLYRYVGNGPVIFTDPSGLVKIEVRYKKLSTLGYYHAYILVTDEKGKVWYFRAGPTKDAGASGASSATGGASSQTRGSTSGGSRSRTSGSNSDSDSKSSDDSSNAGSNSSNSTSPGSGPALPGGATGPWGPIDAGFGEYLPGTIDWQAASENPPTVVIIDNDEPAGYYLDKLKQLTRNVNKNNIPYNPFPGGQNSNTFVHQLIEDLGLKRPQPPVWAPAHGSKIPTDDPGTRDQRRKDQELEIQRRSREWQRLLQEVPRSA